MISSARGHHVPFPFFPGSYFSSSLPGTCQSSLVFASIYLQKKVMKCVVKIQLMECDLKKRCKRMPEQRNWSIEFMKSQATEFYQYVAHEAKDQKILPFYINTPIHVLVMKYTCLIVIRDNSPDCGMRIKGRKRLRELDLEVNMMRFFFGKRNPKRTKKDSHLEGQLPLTLDCWQLWTCLSGWCFRSLDGIWYSIFWKK